MLEITKLKKIFHTLTIKYIFLEVHFQMWKVHFNYRLITTKLPKMKCLYIYCNPNALIDRIDNQFSRTT